MLTQYTLKMPHVVYSGEGALDHIKEIAGTCGLKAVVFSDKGIRAAGLLEAIIPAEGGRSGIFGFRRTACRTFL